MEILQPSISQQLQGQLKVLENKNIDITTKIRQTDFKTKDLTEDDLRNLDTINSAYAELVYIYELLCSHMAELNYMSLETHFLRQDVIDTKGLMQTDKKKILNRIDIFKESLTKSQDYVIPIKASLETKIKFYNSLQYSLTSTRFREMGC